MANNERNMDERRDRNGADRDWQRRQWEQNRDEQGQQGMREYSRGSQFGPDQQRSMYGGRDQSRYSERDYSGGIYEPSQSGRGSQMRNDEEYGGRGFGDEGYGGGRYGGYGGGFDGDRGDWSQGPFTGPTSRGYQRGMDRQQMGGYSSDRGYFDDWRNQGGIGSRYMYLGRSQSFVATADLAFGLRWRGNGSSDAIVSQPIEYVADLDVHGDRLLLAGLRRDDAGKLGADGAFVWLASLPDGALRPILPFTSRGAIENCAGFHVATVRFMSDGSFVIVPGAEPGIYLYDAQGRLQRSFDSERLNLLSQCQMSRDEHTLATSQPEARQRWINRHRIVDEVVEQMGEAFPDLMDRLVLHPAGMTSSSYRQPIDPARHRRAAHGTTSSTRAGSRSGLRVLSSSRSPTTRSTGLTSCSEPTRRCTRPRTRDATVTWCWTMCRNAWIRVRPPSCRC